MSEGTAPGKLEEGNGEEEITGTQAPDAPDPIASAAAALEELETKKRTAEEVLRVISEAQESVSSHVDGIERLVTSAQESSKAITEAKTRAENEAQEATFSKDKAIESATACQQSTNACAAELEKATTLAAQAEAQNKKANNNAAGAETHASAAQESLKKAREAAEESRKLADKADVVDAKLTKYETELTRLQEEQANLGKRTEELLRDATGVGLAKSFAYRKKALFKPRLLYAVTFLVSITGLVVVAALPIGHLAKLPGWGGWSALVYFLDRIPFAAPLVWLAWFAGRHYTFASRIEEDYANKEALSLAFEGYKGQLKDAGQPLDALYELVLAALAREPGRIYLDGNDQVSPIERIAERAFGQIGSTTGETAEAVNSFATAIKTLAEKLK